MKKTSSGKDAQHLATIYDDEDETVETSDDAEEFFRTAANHCGMPKSHDASLQVLLYATKKPTGNYRPANPSYSLVEWLEFTASEAHEFYTEYIRARLFAKVHKDDWLVVVADAKINTNPRSNLPPRKWHKAHSQSISGLSEALIQVQQRSGNTREIYGDRQKVSVEDNLKSFTAGALQLLEFRSDKSWSFKVDFYRHEIVAFGAIAPTIPLKSNFKHTISIDQDTSDRVYDLDIRPRLFDSSRVWDLVVRPREEETTSSFEQPLADITHSVKISGATKVITVEDDNHSPDTPSDLPTANQKAGKGGQSSPLLHPYIGTVYGYAGQISSTNTLESIQDAALRLLDLLPTDDWKFIVDIQLAEGGLDLSGTVHSVTKSNFASQFESVFRKYVGRDRWQLFVRTSSHKPVTVEPDATLKHIAKLVDGTTTAYWKLPEDMTLAYGLNQPQSDFFRAMRIIFPRSKAFAPGSVIINGVDVGFGGMQITPSLWEMVKKHYTAYTSAPILQVTVKNRAPSSTDSQMIGVRLVGSEHYAEVEAGNFEAMMKEALMGLNPWLADHKNPGQFRIWRSASDREAGENPRKLNYGSSETQIAALKAWFESESVPTDCVQFSPDWANFRIVDAKGEKSTAVWAGTSISSISNFRMALRSLFKLEAENNQPVSFSLVEPHSQRRFVVTKDTNSSDWHHNIYDWLHSSRLSVSLDGGVDYGKIHEYTFRHKFTDTIV